VRADVAIAVKYEDDQAVFSEPFTIMALPAKMDAMIGERRLWN
jgi:hypothetical protein